MLMIFVSINTYKNVVLLSWAVVPTENKYWWKWFLKFIAEVYPRATAARQVYISDRDKGIAAAVASCFPEAIPAYCC
jgi:hypothetical protein